MHPRRTLLAAALAAATPPAGAQTLVQSLNSLAARANAGTIGIVTGGVDGTYVRIAADLAAVLDDGDALRVLPILGRGSLQNISDILVLRGVDLGIVQSDVLAYARSRRLLPGLDTLVQYVAKLYDEEVHLLAGPGIGSLADLAGKPVNIDLQGSGTAMTASLLFEGIPIEPRHAPQNAALEQLRRGEIAALAYVTGKPARLFTGLPAETPLRFLPIPMTPRLLETYLPAALAPADYPALIEGEPVETVAVGAVMACYAWTPGTERHRKLARFAAAFEAKFAEFLRPPAPPEMARGRPRRPPPRLDPLPRMSRPEDDDDEDEAPPGLAPGTPFYMTPAGQAALQAELHRLWTEERPKVVEVVSWAAGLGDRSENADYQYGKRRLREIDRRVRFLRKRLERVQVVDPAAQPRRDRVFFGATVTYAREDDREVTVTIVGIDEADTARHRISWVSPVARALLGAGIGDLVRLRTPQGAETLEIVAVAYPDP